MSWARLYRYRVQIEEALRMELTELDRAVQKVNEVRAQWQRIADDDADRLVTEARRGVEAGLAHGWLGEWNAIQMTVTNVDLAVAAAMERRTKKQAELMEAVRDRKKIQLMMTRAADRKQQMQRRLEQRMLDDLAAQRWARDSS
ncbi:MAG TPA: flagellar FliJ family protein [Nitrospiraceae bacterium]|nr:flagellar FliJ family protein [Nitrospiraceae bacterium]